MTTIEKVILAGQVGLVIFLLACLAGAISLAWFGTGWFRQRGDGRPPRPQAPRAAPRVRPERMRSRWGPTVYRGSRADWKPARNTLQRSASAPASTRPPPAIAPSRRRPAAARSAPPPTVRAVAAFDSAPAGPWW